MFSEISQADWGNAVKIAFVYFGMVVVVYIVSCILNWPKRNERVRSLKEKNGTEPTFREAQPAKCNTQTEDMREPRVVVPNTSVESGLRVVVDNTK